MFGCSTHKTPHRSLWRVQRTQNFFTRQFQLGFAEQGRCSSIPTATELGHTAWRPMLCCVAPPYVKHDCSSGATRAEFGSLSKLSQPVTLAYQDNHTRLCDSVCQMPALFQWRPLYLSGRKRHPFPACRNCSPIGEGRKRDRPSS